MFVPLEKLDRILPDVDKRNWVYPQKISGRFTRGRTVLGYVLIAILVAIPLIRINGLPLILFDVPGRRFVLFGQVYWPHDVWLLFFLLFAFFVGILFVTALWGRVWCGYTCPQTVFLHNVVLKVEQWLEGNRNQQMRLDQAPWTWKKLSLKITKHLIFIALSSLLAHVFLSYFMDVRRLTYAILHPSWEYKAPIIFATFMTVAIYTDLVLLREQFCNYICPYARFQSALLDRESLIVGYDANRGEPRAKMAQRKKEGDENFGDCIDCTKCVVVCPQGIDIRNGLQLECIHCARCIDACDSVMDGIGKPRGLIRYASERELEDGAPAHPIRPRTVIYGLLMLASLTTFIVLAVNRPMIEVALLRPAGAVWQPLSDGEIANHFRLKLINKDAEPVHLQLILRSDQPLRLIAPVNPLPVDAGAERATEIFVVGPAELHGTIPFTIEIRNKETGEAHTINGDAIFPDDRP